MTGLVLLNVGNTHTQVALCPPDGLRDTGVLSTARLLQDSSGVALHADIPRAATYLVASVVPAAAAALVAGLGASRVHFIEPALIKAVDFSAVDARTIGQDRLANAAAAVAMGVVPGIVLDCGTAITTEVVDAQHRFRGGAILPGRALLRRALHADTAQLPDVPIAGDCPSAVGANTQQAIRAGVDLGALGSVERVIRETRRELGCRDCPVIAVGGDAEFFSRHLDAVTHGPTDFTLRGLGAIAEQLGLTDAQV